MTIRGRNRITIAAAVTGLGVLAVTLLPMIAASGPDDAREIRLVVRDMAFYLDGGTEPNPTLTVRAGEHVRMVVRNDEPGMRHDFAVTAWEVSTRMLHARGEEDSITFQVPSARGDQTYQCTPHPKMMRGTIRVR